MPKRTWPADVSQLYPRWYRMGIGNDIHRLAEGRKLILGGVHIPFDKGPVGHSDGDVLAHAICDALLGAARLGDIGRHFPNTSPEWKNASSLLFLRHVRQLLDAAGYSIINIDATVGLERPKLAPAHPLHGKESGRGAGAQARPSECQSQDLVKAWTPSGAVRPSALTPWR